MVLFKMALLNFMKDTLGMDTTGVDEDTPLFSSGMIDSSSMVELILFVEAEGHVKFEAEDVSLDRLDSIRRIVTFVGERSER